MQSRAIYLGEGASTPYYRAVPVMDPILVVCPIWGMALTPAVVQEIYRVALERSHAAIRPAFGHRISMN
jgi:hypothetical protein